MAMDYKTFPLTVTQKWLDQVDDARKKQESKHEFIVKAVDEKIKRRQAEREEK